MVADCGGGTVDLTVHQLEQPHGTLKELYKASGEYQESLVPRPLTPPGGRVCTDILLRPLSHP